MIIDSNPILLNWNHSRSREDCEENVGYFRYEDPRQGVQKFFYFLQNDCKVIQKYWKWTKNSELQQYHNHEKLTEYNESVYKKELIAKINSDGIDKKLARNSLTAFLDFSAFIASRYVCRSSISRYYKDGLSNDEFFNFVFSIARERTSDPVNLGKLASGIESESTKRICEHIWTKLRAKNQKLKSTKWALLSEPNESKLEKILKEFGMVDEEIFNFKVVLYIYQEVYDSLHNIRHSPQMENNPSARDVFMQKYIKDNHADIINKCHHRSRNEKTYTFNRQIDLLRTLGTIHQAIIKYNDIRSNTFSLDITIDREGSQTKIDIQDNSPVISTEAQDMMNVVTKIYHESIDSQSKSILTLKYLFNVSNDTLDICFGEGGSGVVSKKRGSGVASKKGDSGVESKKGGSGVASKKISKLITYIINILHEEWQIGSNSILKEIKPLFKDSLTKYLVSQYRQFLQEHTLDMSDNLVELFIQRLIKDSIILDRTILTVKDCEIQIKIEEFVRVNSPIY
jgi:hypothetical protein